MRKWPALPGESPIDDFSGLRIKAVRTRADLNRAEYENIADAAERYLARKPSRRTAPFTLRWLFKLHREMFGRVWVWAGKPRKSQTNIGAPVHQIETSLQDLLDDLVFWDKTGMDPMEQAARLHHRAVQIHPFLNGNGRWARLLANVWLRANGLPLARWPEEAIAGVSPIRGEYLAAIRLADGGEYDSLVALHKRYAANI